MRNLLRTGHRLLIWLTSSPVHPFPPLYNGMNDTCLTGLLRAHNRQSTWGRLECLEGALKMLLPIPSWRPCFWLQEGKGLREGQVMGVPVSAVWCREGGWDLTGSQDTGSTVPTLPVCGMGSHLCSLGLWFHTCKVEASDYIQTLFDFHTRKIWRQSKQTALRGWLAPKLIYGDASISKE